MKKLLYTTVAVVAGVMLFSSNVYAGAKKTCIKKICKTEIHYNKHKHKHTDGRDAVVEEAGRLVAEVLSGDMTPAQLDSVIDTAKAAGVPQEDLDRAKDIWEDRLGMKNGIADLEEAVGNWDPATKGTIAQAITDLQNGQGDVSDLRTAVDAANGRIDALDKIVNGDPNDSSDRGLVGDVSDLEKTVGTWTPSKHSNNTIAGQVDANEKAIADLKDDMKNVADDVTEQVKGELSGDITAGDADTLVAAKDYTDDKVADIADGIASGDADTLGKANDYTDGKVADIAGDIASGDADTLVAAKDYTDDKVADIAGDIASGDADTLGKANDYTDGKVAGFGTWNPSAHNGNTMADQVADNTAGINGINQKLANGDIATKETVGAAKQEAMDYADAQDQKVFDAADHNAQVYADAAETNAKNYADAQDQKVFAAANENAKGYAKNAENNAKNYADAQDQALEQKVTAAYQKADAEMEARITKAYTKADEAIKQGVFIAEGIDRLDSKVSKMNKQMKTSFAAGAAMAALVPNARAEGNTHLAAGTGYYDGKMGAAIGLFHYIDDNVLLNAGLAYAGRDSLTAKGGVTVGF